jgi:chromatin assembly factor 1 subunit A
MDPPRIPLNAINRLNLQLPNPLPQDGTKPNSTPPSIATPAKTAKQAQIKRYVAPDLLEGFKAAVKGSDLTKLGLVEVLKKQ